jgi:hypothetical protein
MEVKEESFHSMKSKAKKSSYRDRSCSGRTTIEPFRENSFPVQLCEIGESKFDCLLSYFCLPCAISLARHRLDGSPLNINFFCRPCTCCNPVPRWLLTRAYEIEETLSRTILLSIFCAPCSANQMLQTARLKGQLPDTGQEANVHAWRYQAENRPLGCCTMLSSIACGPCIVASTLEAGLDMPWNLAFWYVKSPQPKSSPTESKPTTSNRLAYV